MRATQMPLTLIPTIILFSLTLDLCFGQIAGEHHQTSLATVSDLEEDGAASLEAQSSWRKHPKGDSSRELGAAEDANVSTSIASTTSTTTTSTTAKRCSRLFQQKGCGYQCLDSVIYDLLPGPNGETCGSAIPAYAGFLQNVADFPFIGQLYTFNERSPVKIPILSLFPYTSTVLGKEAATGTCKDLMGLRPNAQYCIFEIPSLLFSAVLGVMKIPGISLAVCIAIMPSWPPTISFSFSGVEFPFPPWSIQFLGVMVSFDGCALYPLKPFMSTNGELQGGFMTPHIGVVAAVSWGVQLPWFQLGITLTAEVSLDLDPFRDGSFVNPASVITAMFKQACIEDKDRDWRLNVHAYAELAMNLGGDTLGFSIKFARIYTQLLLDSSPLGTTLHVTVGLEAISSLGSVFGDQYKWYVQDTGVEEQICATLTRVTFIAKEMNPFCKDDFKYFRQADVANLMLTMGTDGVAAQVSFMSGVLKSSATLKRMHNGWEMCINNKCHARRCFFDPDCARAGYSCYNVCSPHNLLCKPKFICQRQLQGCYCGIWPAGKYKTEEWTRDSCNSEFGCTVDDLWQATAHKHCQGRGGSAYCMETQVGLETTKTYCDGASPGRRLSDPLLGPEHCFPSSETATACVDGTCAASVGPAKCVEGKCLCLPGYCPSSGRTHCLPSQESRIPATLARPGQILIHPEFEKKFGRAADVDSFMTPLSVPNASVANRALRGRFLNESSEPECYCGEDGPRPIYETIGATTTTTTQEVAPPTGIELKTTTGSVSMTVTDPDKLINHEKAHYILSKALQMAIQETTSEMVYRQWITIDAIERQRRLWSPWRRLQDSGTVLVKYSVQFPYNSEVDIDPETISEATLRAEANREAEIAGIAITFGTVKVHKPTTWVHMSGDDKAADTVKKLLTPQTLGLIIGGSCLGIFGFSFMFWQCFCRRGAICGKKKKKGESTKKLQSKLKMLNALTSASDAQKGLRAGADVYGNAHTGHSQPSPQPSYGSQPTYAQNPTYGGQPTYAMQVTGQPTQGAHVTAQATYAVQVAGQPTYAGQVTGQPTQGAHVTAQATYAVQVAGQPTYAGQVTAPPNHGNQPVQMMATGTAYGQQQNCMQQPTYGQHPTYAQNPGSGHHVSFQPSCGHQPSSAQPPNYGGQQTNYGNQLTYGQQPTQIAASPRTYGQSPQDCDNQPGYGQQPTYGQQQTYAQNPSHAAGHANLLVPSQAYGQQPTNQVPCNQTGYQTGVHLPVSPGHGPAATMTANSSHNTPKHGHGHGPAATMTANASHNTPKHGHGHHAHDHAHGNQAHGNRAHGNQAHGNQAHGNQAHGNQAPGHQAHGTPHHGLRPHAVTDPQSYQASHGANHGKHDDFGINAVGFEAPGRDRAHSNHSRKAKSKGKCKKKSPKSNDFGIDANDSNHDEHPDQDMVVSGASAPNAFGMQNVASNRPDFPAQPPLSGMPVPPWGHGTQAEAASSSAGTPSPPWSQSIPSSSGNRGSVVLDDFPTEIPHPVHKPQATWAAACNQDRTHGRDEVQVGTSLAHWHVEHQAASGAPAEQRDEFEAPISVAGYNTAGAHEQDFSFTYNTAGAKE